MVYESDFYTTRRPYRYTPSYSTYTVTTVPSRQVRVLPGLGKVHIIHNYDRIVPYVGHKRLTVVTTPPKVYSTRPSVLQREYDWIESKVRPWVAYSATNNYLNSNSAVRIVYNRYPDLWNDSYSSSSFYRKYGPVSYYSSNNWPYDDYWTYRTYGNWRYWPYYRYLRTYFSNLPLYRNYYLDSWFDRYIDWCYHYWPKYRSTNYVSSISAPSIRNYYWYWPTYYPRRMVYARSPITGLYHPNYLPVSGYTNYYRIYRPLYSYDYWPSYTSLNYLTNWWPRYRYISDDDLSYRSLRMQRIFDDETRLIRAQTASLLKSIHLPVPRHRTYPITSLNRYGEYPARLSNDHYINRLMHISPKNSKVEFVTYYTDPVKKYIGQGHLSCVYYVGDRGSHGRRRNVYIYEDPVRNDIQLLSFYINKFKEEKQQKAIEPAKVPLSPCRPSRRFNAAKQHRDEIPQEIQELREARAARLAKINAEDTPSVEDALKAKKQQEEARLAEEKRLAEEQAAREAEEQAAREAKEAKERKEKAARDAAEKAAELERQAELLKQEEIAKQAELERARKEEEERLKAEEERRLAEEAKAEEERKQLERLEEIARQAEEEREAELARQAEELAELARQEAELAEQAKREAEGTELARQEQELAELKRQEEELAELERQERELAEAAEKAKEEAEQANKEAEEAEEENQEAETVQEEAEIEQQQEEVNETGNEEEEIVQEEEPLAEEVQADEPEEDEEEPIAEAEDTPSAQGDTADEAEDEEEEEEEEE